MTISREATALATAALLVAALTSCADHGDDPTASPSATPSSPAPTTTTATTKPPSESEIASTAAAALVTKYYATVDRLGQQPTASLDQLSTVATGVQLSAERNLLKSQRKANEKQVGDTKVVKLDVQSVNLENSDPSAGKVPTVQIDVCWDVGQVDVVDATGKSVVSKSRPNAGWTRLTVANYYYAADPTAGWRVATGQDLKRDPCVAS